MKKIVLLGDSIRMSYDKYVKEALKDVAEVYYPDENCRFTQHILRFAHEWRDRNEWPHDMDLVHWNVGLWDCVEIFYDQPLTSIEYYAEAIARIDKRLRMLYPKAKMVFGTTTSVAEELAPPTFIRHNEVIRRYNEAAIEALKGTDTIINDLYTYTSAFPMEYRHDSVHFKTKTGAAEIGKEIISLICRELNVSASDVALENFEPENYTKDAIAF